MTNDFNSFEEPKKDELFDTDVRKETTAGETCEQDETDSEVDPDLALTRKINALSKLLLMYYSRTSKNKGFSDPLHGQGRVLALLTVKPETTQKELLFLLGMKQQSLSELLSKLEAKGFITREKSEKDGRVAIIKLTEAGRAAAPDTSGEQESFGVYDCLDPEERARFEKDIDDLSDSLLTKVAEAEVDESCDKDHDGEEQKRHRYGQQGHGRPAHGGHGKGSSGKGSKTYAIADLASAAIGSSSLGDIATQVLKEASNSSILGTSNGKGSMGHGSGKGNGGGRGKGRGGRH